MSKKNKTFYNERISERVKDCGTHIAETGDTIRATAKVFGCSKSTVHLDVSQRLLNLNKRLYNKVQKKLAKNKAERHIRGGLATKHKYEDVKGIV